MIPQGEMDVCQEGQITITSKLISKLREIVDGELVGARYDEGDNLVCYYCGEPIAKYSTHRDHVTPKSKGGSNQNWNIVLTCSDCNIRKNARHPFYYLERLPSDLELDYLARMLFGATMAQPYITLRSRSKTTQSDSMLGVADKLAVLGDQLQQITGWMHTIEQEIIDHQ